MATDLKNFRRKLENTFRETVQEITGRQNMSQLGDFIVKDMLRRIRLGYGVRKNGGTRERLKPLSTSYVEQRRNKLGFWTNSNGNAVPIYTLGGKESREFRASENARIQSRRNRAYLKQNNPKLDRTTSPKKSNLTRTGRMLRSVGHLYTQRRLIIGFKTTKSGQKAAYVSQERPFFFMTDQEERRATRFLQRRFRQLLARNVRKNF